MNTDQRNDDFAIRMSFKFINVLELLAQHPVIVYLAVDSKRQAAILVGQGLCTSVYTDDTQAFMGEDAIVRGHVSTPVRPAMSCHFGHLKSRRLEFLHIRVLVAREDSAHDCDCHRRLIGNEVKLLHDSCYMLR